MFLGQAEDHQDSEDGTEESFTLPLRGKRQEQQEAAILVDRLLRERLGSLAPLVMQYLDRPAARRNTMPVRNLALASIRFDVLPTAAAALASGFLQDLIADGHLSPDISYLVCDPNKLRRARQDAMASARDLDQGKHQGTKIVGLSYDGRKDKTRAMVPDSYGKLHPRLIREEHVSVTEEPSGRWLTTAQSLVYMWTRKHGLTGKELNTLEILVKYCLQVYFKLYYDIRVHHRLEDGPKHILTQLRVMRSQPKKVQTAVTFYVRTGALFAHSECVLLSLMASQSEDDRSLQTLISWQPGQVHEPAFTCSLSGDQIQEILVKPYEVPEFSIHTQNTERVMKQVTEAAAAVVGQQARDWFIRARAHHRETMPCFRSKKDMMDTF
ncbi:hypothetical protein GWK47_025973 [Chionoecetes opilio]|uniref:Uncharacterized protein n=1 Tax=Chionoecetes opilio TaxID=41210 RepID=A0A8J8WFV4_CHIOP|nr:hypothetical protein GWK47_025973 [Chionoecetes opilio]